MNVQWSIASLGPLVFGDGRPFSNQPGVLTVRGLDLPYPSTLTGALVTPLLGRPVDGNIPGLGHFHVRGPLLRVNDEVVFPTPQDAVPVKRGPKHFLAPMRPGGTTEGADFPDACQQPALVDLRALEGEGFEREKSPECNYITCAQMLEHLIDDGAQTREAGLRVDLMREKRIGNAIAFESQKADDGKLFSTSGVNLARGLKPIKNDPVLREASRVEIVCATSLGNHAEPPDMLRFALGGEARQAVLRREEGMGPFVCPDEIRKALAETTRIKLILATPAQFGGGWLPEWLEQECPTARLKFQLVSACVGRRQAVSGWGSSPKNKGPKPATWLAPAGSVYFLKLIDPPDDYAERLAQAWLQPMSDDSRFRRKGFGLALWGTWKGHGEA